MLSTSRNTARDPVVARGNSASISAPAQRRATAISTAISAAISAARDAACAPRSLRAAALPGVAGTNVQAVAAEDDCSLRSAVAGAFE